MKQGEQGVMDGSPSPQPPGYLQSNHGGDERGAPLPVSHHVLVLYDKSRVSVAKEIQGLLQSHRVSHHIRTYNLPFDLVTSDPTGGKLGRYCLILCAGYYKNIQHLSDYSNRFNVSIVSFVSVPLGRESASMGVVNLINIRPRTISGVRLNTKKEFYYLKTGEWVTQIQQYYRWTTFVRAESAGLNADSDDDNMDWDVWASVRYHGNSNSSSNLTTPLVLVMRNGRGWGASVMIGSPITFWLSKLILLEVIRSHSLHPVLRFGRDRWMMIDIDDIFVAPEGLKMSTEDVEVRFKGLRHAPLPLPLSI